MQLKILNYRYAFMISVIRLTASIFLMNCMVSCGDHMILEKKYTASLTVNQVNKSPLLALQIKGLAMHSAMGISQIESFQESDKLVILVHLTLIRGKLSGNLDTEITVPSDVNAVLFGENRAEIWRRR